MFIPMQNGGYFTMANQQPSGYQGGSYQGAGMNPSLGQPQQAPQMQVAPQNPMTMMNHGMNGPNVQMPQQSMGQGLMGSNPQGVPQQSAAQSPSILQGAAGSGTMLDPITGKPTTWSTGPNGLSNIPPQQSTQAPQQYYYNQRNDPRLQGLFGTQQQTPFDPGQGQQRVKG